MRPGAVSAARDALTDWIDSLAETGPRSRDVAALFYAFERVRRWGGNNPREFEPSETKVLPFCTRPYILAAYRVPAADRYIDVVPRGLIGCTVPAMLSEPGFDRPWRSPAPPVPAWRSARWTVTERIPLRVRPVLTRLAHTVRRPNPRPAERGIWREIDWLEARREWLRDVALSQSSSAYWDYVDRRRFEYLMDARTSPRIRGRWMLPLFAASSLFVYDHLSETE